MRHRVLFGVFLLLGGMLAAGAVQAQTSPPQNAAPAASLTLASLAGRYEGSAVTPEGAQTFVADLKVENDVITGVITTQHSVVTITRGSVAGDKFTLTIDMDGAPGSMSGAVKDGRFEGQWTVGEDSGTFTMKKVAASAGSPGAAGPAAATAQKPGGAAAPAGADPLTGDWDAVMDVGGNQFPFVLSIKLDGQKATGQMSSERGAVPFEGTWTDGTLRLSFVGGPNGIVISMTATFVEGKLAGTFSIGDGQMTGGWAAAKRK